MMMGVVVVDNDSSVDSDVFFSSFFKNNPFLLLFPLDAPGTYRLTVLGGIFNLSSDCIFSLAFADSIPSSTRAWYIFGIHIFLIGFFSFRNPSTSVSYTDNAERLLT